MDRELTDYNDATPYSKHSRYEKNTFKDKPRYLSIFMSEMGYLFKRILQPRRGLRPNKKQIKEMHCKNALILAIAVKLVRCNSIRLIPW